MLDTNALGNLTLPEKMVEYVQATSTAMEKAAAAEQQQLEKQAAADKLVPDVASVLIDRHFVPANQRDKLAAALGDHAETLRLLAKVAAYKHDDSARLGTPVAEKTASALPVIGQRSARGPVRESTAAIFRGLGLPVPSSD